MRDFDTLMFPVNDETLAADAKRGRARTIRHHLLAGIVIGAGFSAAMLLGLIVEAL